jgi:hypothetical protein
LLSLREYKAQKQQAEINIKEAEDSLKAAFEFISPSGDWVSALSHRFKVVTCEGRKSLDKVSPPYQRLYVSPINNG